MGFSQGFRLDNNNDNKQWFYSGWASEILHQLKTVVNIPLFRLGFNHPFGEAGFRNYPQYDDG
jgi:hypothetical protein